MTCTKCGLPIHPAAAPIHPSCEAGWQTWPPPGCKLARGEGPAKAEFEEHMKRAQGITEGWQQRPRGKR